MHNLTSELIKDIRIVNTNHNHYFCDFIMPIIVVIAIAGALGVFGGLVLYSKGVKERDNDTGVFGFYVFLASAALMFTLFIVSPITTVDFNSISKLEQMNDAKKFINKYSACAFANDDTHNMVFLTKKQQADLEKHKVITVNSKTTPVVKTALDEKTHRIASLKTEKDNKAFRVKSKYIIFDTEYILKRYTEQLH